MNEVFNDQLLYVGEHLSCSQYMQDITYGFSLRNIEAGFHEEVTDLVKNIVIFVLEGKSYISYKKFKDVPLKKNSFIFLPKGANLSYHVEQDTVAIFFTFETLLSGCDQNLLQSCSKYIDRITYKFAPVKMREPMQQYCHTIKYSLEQKVNCRHFHELKHKEFFMYLRYFYTKEEITNFLYPIVGVKPDFKQFILNNWKIGMSVDDIIAKMPMSKSTFIRTFDQFFKMTPYTWYQRLICDKITQKAIFPGTTTKDLMEVAQITDASQFNRFCRRNFNCTPKMLLDYYSKVHD
jgi:AraC-like DNA-binding protein